MDKEYFEACVKQYENMVFRIALNHCRNYDDAEDITQEVFFRFFHKVKKPPASDQVKYYLIRMAVNLSINMTRSAWKTKVVCSDEAWMDALYQRTDVEPDKKERYQELVAAVRSLPVKYRDVVHLYYGEELPVRQISQILKRKETTVQTQLMRARKLLKERLEDVDK